MIECQNKSEKKNATLESSVSPVLAMLIRCCTRFERKGRKEINTNAPDPKTQMPFPVFLLTTVSSVAVAH